MIYLFSDFTNLKHLTYLINYTFLAMKTFFALALLVASISAASLEQRPQYDVEQIRKELNYALSISEHHNPLLENVDAEGLSLKFLCKPCTTLLAFIKKELASMTKIESDVLKPVVHVS